MFPNRIQRPQQPRQQTKKEEKCKITIKKKKDGTITKEVSAGCSKSQLRALQEIDEPTDIED